MSFTEDFLRLIPKALLKLLYAVCILFLLLLGFSLLYVDRDSASFVIVILTLIPIVILLLAVSIIIYYKPKDKIPSSDSE